MVRRVSASSFGVGNRPRVRFSWIGSRISGTPKHCENSFRESARSSEIPTAANPASATFASSNTTSGGKPLAVSCLHRELKGVPSSEGRAVGAIGVDAVAPECRQQTNGLIVFDAPSGGRVKTIVSQTARHRLPMEWIARRTAMVRVARNRPLDRITQDREHRELSLEKTRQVPLKVPSKNTVAVESVARDRDDLVPTPDRADLTRLKGLIDVTGHRRAGCLGDVEKIQTVLRHDRCRRRPVRMA